MAHNSVSMLFNIVHNNQIKYYIITENQLQLHRIVRILGAPLDHAEQSLTVVNIDNDVQTMKQFRQNLK